MILRDLMIERILFACDEDTLIRNYGITEDHFEDLSDLDLFEMYEDAMGINEITRD
ncbi:hypothetical protein UFOVP240_50 [uncultured Caudovirales phage]|jgi:hypothetical protein|uniref:Uncharacterized protein n=1 Tax=uncultured Caudovirales phage TaxID=2100421 RepID=A0A6J7WSD7_9CAUD|nr:hypothetical protein UFOVP240_50 [uncultured Caudovirales phage]